MRKSFGLLSLLAVAATSSLLAQGCNPERDRWNAILTSPTPRFNTAPNQFLVDTTRGLKPGLALDVGMGQGRNTIFLAKQGWDVTGFDPADKAVALADQLAAKAGVSIKAKVGRMEDFDWGKDRWDLVVFCYVPVRGFVERVSASLKPGGVVVLEAFHSEGPLRAGAGVVWDSNELLTAFRDFRILHYEDAVAKADFGLQETRIVRLCAQRPR